MIQGQWPEQIWCSKCKILFVDTPPNNECPVCDTPERKAAEADAIADDAINSCFDGYGMN